MREKQLQAVLHTIVKCSAQTKYICTCLCNFVLNKIGFCFALFLNGLILGDFRN